MKTDLVKDLVWLPKELCEKIKRVESDGELENLVMQHIKESKFNINNELENLDENILQYRGLMIKSRNEFKKAKEEELDSYYTLWEKYEEDINGIKEKVNEIKNFLSPLKKELKEVEELMNKIRIYDFKELNEVLRIFSSLYGENKKILEFLFENYKKE